MPKDVLIPVVGYPSVSDAVAWLDAAFGFTLRWQVGDHRAQVAVHPDAAIAIVVGDVPASADHVMVRVENLESHRARAAAGGASVGAIGEFPYGERQYNATDFAGREWVFTESVADVGPLYWGATVSR